MSRTSRGDDNVGITMGSRSKRLMARVRQLAKAERLLEQGQVDKAAPLFLDALAIVVGRVGDLAGRSVPPPPSEPTSTESQSRPHDTGAGFGATVLPLRMLKTSIRRRPT